MDNLHTADCDSWIDVDTKKAKRSKNKIRTKLSVSQPAELINDVINAVAGDIAHTSCASTQTESDDFCRAEDSPLQLMKSELKQLRETVDKLSNKIDRLTTAMHSELPTNTKPTNPSYATVTSVTSAPSASTVHAAEKHNRSDHSSSSHHERDPVTAMYMDLNLKKQRANNIVITGMPPTQSPDHEIKAVVELLASEFDWDNELWPGVSVARCRRLGKPQEGKCQPLLVTLDSQIQAEFYIKNARELRNSSQAEVRNNVFINPDLTQAEARAAYELRQRRKQRRQESDSKSQGNHNNSTRTFYPSTHVEPRLKWRAPAAASEHDVLPDADVLHLFQSLNANSSDEALQCPMNVDLAAPSLTANTPPQGHADSNTGRQDRQ